MTTVTDIHETVARLASLDCCALSDALDSLGMRGQVTGLPARSGNRRIAGQAITVKVGTGTPPPGPARHLGTTAIGLGGPDHVIVVEQRSGIEAGCWGGLLTLGAKQRGIAGVVADGPVRDVDEAQRYDFPIFSRTLTALTARGRVVELGTNVPVMIGEVQVHPGDFVVADGSGVIFIPAQHVAAVLDAAEKIAAREAGIAKAVLGGMAITEAMGGNYEHMLKGDSK